MRCVSFTLAALTALLLAACAPEEPAAKPAAPPMPSESLTRPPQAPEPVTLTADAEAMKAAILREADTRAEALVAEARQRANITSQD